MIVTGPAASGKTSVARLLADRSDEPSVHLQGDDFFRSLKIGRLRGWEAGSTPQHEVVFDAIANAARAYANGGYFVVLDSLIRPRYLDIVVDVIKADDIHLDFVVLRPTFSEVQTRSGEREANQRHGGDVLEDLYGAFLDLGPLESHVIDNTTFDVNQAVETILSRIANRELRI